MVHLDEHLKSMTPLQRAVFALRETQARLEALERKLAEPMAIIGMACRFPGGAIDPASYWRLICERVDAIGEIPPDRWDADAFYDPDPAAPGKTNSRWGGFLERIDEFDNHFFGISDREAARIDPQHRLLLELAWEALEDAGLPPARLRGSKTGVFLGISVSEYGLVQANDLSQTDAHAATGISLCLAANRLSFVFGWRAPSVALDTACSSSLVALHLACQSIRNGDCDAALVGGVSLLLSPIASINLTKAGFCAADGRVRAFDAAASGYVRSEGAGLVMIKPLTAALQDKDSIYAIIRGSAVNQNGQSNGLTAPSRAAQEQVLRDAYRRARISPGQVQFVETQGTGTPLGDTIEALALGDVLREDRPPDRPCAIGAVKTNIGHLEAASGIAGLMKAALALKHRQLPPNLHFETPNPDIPFSTLPLRVQQTLEPWPETTQPRIAGVSAFGFGGSNSHVVLEEPPQERPTPAEPISDGATAASPARFALPLLLSARTEKALHDLAERYTRFLRHDPPAWPDVCYTAAAHREHHDCRLAVLADSHEQAIGLLESFLSGESGPDILTGRKPFGREPKVAFLFGDQAESCIPDVLRSLKAIPDFATAMEEIDAVCRRVAGRSLETAANDVRGNDSTQARFVLVALQLTLTEWWRRVGIVPAAVLGRGASEFAAAAAAGILTAEEALRLIVDGHRANGDSPFDRLRPQPAALPFLSSVDGKLHAGPDLDAVHWQSCIEHSQGMTTALAALASRHIDVCLEIGKGTAPFTRSEKPDNSAGGGEVRAAIAILYAAGADILWERLASNARCRVRVPTYPWQRQRLWALGHNRFAKSPTRAPIGDDLPQSQGLAAAPAVAATIRVRPGLTVPYVAPRTQLEMDMAESWAAILRIEGIGIHDNFFELGGDSLQATILLNQLEEHLGEAVPGHVLFQVQTINDLADYLRQHCPDAVHWRYPDEAIPPDGKPAGAAPSPEVAKDTGGGSDVSIPRLARDDQAEDLLARLDELSDEEVELLLATTTGDGETRHE